MTCSDYNIGDKLVIISRTKQGDQKTAAFVTDINCSGNGLVSYFGDYHRNGMLNSGSGAFDPTKLRTTKFGICWDVEKVPA